MDRYICTADALVVRVDTLDLVRAQGVLRTLLLALLARVPLSAIGLLLVLEVRDLDHSYALAGACSGACALGMAFGSPALGRLIDRTGQAPVLVWSGLAVMACTTAFALLPESTPAPLFLLVALAIGATQPPVGSCVRVLWRRMLDKPRFGALVTLDASLQELAFMSGPLLLIAVATASTPASALVVTGALLGGTALVFAALPETRRLGGAAGTSQVTTEANPTPAPARSPLADPSIRVLLVISALMGIAFGATEIGIVTGAEEEHASGSAGILFALWGVGSFAGGLVWARRGAGLDQTRAALAFLTVLGITSLALVAATDLWLLGAGLVLAGAAVAPLFGVLYGLMADVAAPETLTEAFTWETSAITAGIALGSTIAGAIAGALEPTASFAVAGAAFLGAAVLAGGWGGNLRVATTCRVATAHH